jgi:hypothetical protein
MEFKTGVISFNEASIITLKKEDNGEIYVALKPIIDALGLEWKRQYQRIVANDRYQIIRHSIYLNNKQNRDMLCINAKKLPAFLFSINPAKVKEENRAKLIAFQDETEWAIYEYWTKGEVKQADFVSSDAFRQLQEHLFQLELDKRELNAQITTSLKTIGEQSLELDNQNRSLQWDNFWLHQEKLKFLAKMKEYATEFYAICKEIDNIPNGYGTYSIRTKVDGFARKMWTHYSAFRDELEFLEAQGA